MSSLSKSLDDDDKHSSEFEATSARSKVPIWLPISAFLGTSAAIAIPLLMLRRGGKGSVKLARVALTETSSSGATTTPLRRRQTASSSSATSFTDHRARLARAPTPTPSSSSFKTESPSDETSPGVGSLMSAMSQLNLNNAMFAGKAFVIATCLVAVGGGTFAWGIKTVLGVEEAHEFGTKMRSFLWSAWPSLATRIHRSPQTDEERRESLRVAPYGVQEEWTAEASENRLRKAYDEGGVMVWAQVALRELEAEARVERAKRQQEIDEAATAKS